MSEIINPNQPMVQPDHALTTMIMQVYDASCEWVPLSGGHIAGQPTGRRQFRADIFRQRLNVIFEQCETAKFMGDEESLHVAAKTMIDSGVKGIG